MAAAALFEEEEGPDGWVIPITDPDLLPGLQADYRRAQQDYAKELAKQEDAPRLVSDMVTFGSPLGRADILLAERSEKFRKRKERREYPTCPPFFENWAMDAMRFTYPRDDPARIPHHASGFAPTVWSNVYFPERLLFFGDPLAGACAPHFGPGVVDHVLPNKGLRFQHRDYWKEGEDEVSKAAIAALREALNLPHNPPPSPETSEQA